LPEPVNEIRPAMLRWLECLPDDANVTEYLAPMQAPSPPTPTRPPVEPYWEDAEPEDEYVTAGDFISSDFLTPMQAPMRMPDEVVEADDEVMLPVHLYNRYHMNGGRVHPNSIHYVVVPRRDCERMLLEGMPYAEFPPPLGRCVSCGLRSVSNNRCENCAYRTRETAEAIANGGRRFGIELEFSVPYGSGDPDPDECDCALCRENYGRERCGQLSAESIASELNAAGVPCTAPGYTHAVYPGTWKIVPDGSLENGWELVSPPMQWDAANVQVRTACAVLKDLGCRATSDCGLHVHHDVGDMTTRTAAMLARNWQACQSATERLVERDRLYSEWCRRTPRSITNAQCDIAEDLPLSEFLYIDGERYRQLNWTCWNSYGTVEVRMHESTLDADAILAWVAYSQSIVEASMECRYLDSVRDVDGALNQLRIRRAAGPFRTRSKLLSKARPAPRSQ